MSSDLDKVYKKQILEEAKNAYHFETREGMGHQERAYNPVCGDRFDLYFNEVDSVITELYFSGFGCTISKASTSMMIKALEGKTRDEAIKIAEKFLSSIASNSASQIQEMEAFDNPEHFKGRSECIVLSWTALKNYLEKL